MPYTFRLIAAINYKKTEMERKGLHSTVIHPTVRIYIIFYLSTSRSLSCWGASGVGDGNDKQTMSPCLRMNLKFVHLTTAKLRTECL